MNTRRPDAPHSWRGAAELRIGLVTAGLMLAIPGAAQLATRWGWVEGTEFSERAVMVLLAGLIVLTGNTIPKHLAFRVRDPNAEGCCWASSASPAGPGFWPASASASPGLGCPGVRRGPRR